MSGIIPPQKYSFFCDESGISNDRFCVVGGLCLNSATIPDIHSTISEYRKHHNMNAELKWERVSNQKIDEYRALVDYFFAMNNANYLQFHCVIFDNHKWKNQQFNGGDRDMGLSKLYYQLLHHKFTRNCGPDGSLFVCLDRRNSSTPHKTLQDMLNAAALRDFQIPERPIKQLVSADSKKETLLQINDVILGAVCAYKNDKHLLPNGRAAKRDLAKYVLKKSGLEDYNQDTPKRQTRFSIWNFLAR